MSRESAASNFVISNFRLVTSKIRYFEFRYLEFSRKIVNFSLWTLRKIFRKFDDFSWKIGENKGRLSMKFVCITFAQYCTCSSCCHVIMLLIWTRFKQTNVFNSLSPERSMLHHQLLAINENGITWKFSVQEIWCLPWSCTIIDMFMYSFVCTITWSVSQGSKGWFLFRQGKCNLKPMTFP